MKTKAIIKIISVTLAVVSIIGVMSACAGKKNDTEETKKKKNKENQAVTEITSDEAEKKAVTTESEDPYAKYDLPLDSLSDQEIFEFCHRTLTLELIDGESSEDLEKRLPSVVEMGKYPYSVSMEASLIYGYGTPLDSGICMTEVAFCCNCDYVKDVITNLTPEDTAGYMDRLTSVTMRITNGRGEELYEYFKEQYAAMYPDTEIQYLKDEYDNWFDFRIKTEDGMFAHARITHFRDGHDELFVEEAHYMSTDIIDA